MMNHLTVFDTFCYPGKLRQYYNMQIERMKELAAAYNFYDQTVKLYFFGDERSGVRFRVDSPDPATKSRIEAALRQFNSQQKSFHYNQTVP